MSELRASSAAVQLQPAVGSPLTGFAVRLEPSTGVHDALMAKLLLLDDGGTRVLWIACDLIGFDPGDDARFRGMLASKLSMPAGNILVSCTHTHSGPCSMPFRGALCTIDGNWVESTFERIAAAAQELPSRLRPARVAHGRETVSEIGYNRQDRTSPIDERLLVAQVSDAASGEPIATLLNYATHPVVLSDNNLLFTGDFAGYATRFVEETLGSGVAMFIQGSAGDVNPFLFRDHPREAGTFEVAEQLGRKLATAAVRAIGGAKTHRDPRLATTEQRVELPLEPPPSREELAKLKSEFLALRGPPDTIPSSRQGRWAMFQLAWIEDLERAAAQDAVPRALPVQLYAARIGDLLAVTFPLEIYSQIGLDVREQLDPRPVIIAGYTNGLFGYAPTDRAIDQGGYGPADSHRFFPHLLTPLARGTAALLTAAAVKLGTLLTNTSTPPAAAD